jgi:hypothetical protein
VLQHGRRNIHEGRRVETDATGLKPGSTDHQEGRLLVAREAAVLPEPKMTRLPGARARLETHARHAMLVRAFFCPHRDGKRKTLLRCLTYLMELFARHDAFGPIASTEEPVECRHALRAVRVDVDER